MSLLTAGQGFDWIVPSREPKPSCDSMILGSPSPRVSLLCPAPRNSNSVTSVPSTDQQTSRCWSPLAQHVGTNPLVFDAEGSEISGASALRWCDITNHLWHQNWLWHHETPVILQCPAEGRGCSCLISCSWTCDITNHKLTDHMLPGPISCSNSPRSQTAQFSAILSANTFQGHLSRTRSGSSGWFV